MALAEQGHLYGDKYAVADELSVVARECVLSTLRTLGMTAEHEARAAGFGRERSAVLRFESGLQCSFVRKQKREISSDTKHVREYVTGAFRGAFTSSSSSKHTEWVWKLRSHWSLVLLCGADRMVLQSREGFGEVVREMDSQPYSDSSSNDPVDLIVNWAVLPAVAIDRKTAVTPRRNPQVDAAISFASELSRWANRVSSLLRADVLTGVTIKVDQSSLNDASLFTPVLPLMAPLSLTLLPDAKALSVGHVKSLQSKKSELAVVFEANAAGLFAAAEAWLVVVCLHLHALAVQLTDGLNHIEELLRMQLVAAIGREVDSDDFEAYMRFHNARLFLPQYQPRPFCYAVRRPDHYPEGVLSIEAAPEQELRRPPATLQECVARGVCTYAVSGATYPEQFWYFCRSCWSGDNNGCCAACAVSCHAGHDVVPHKLSGFYCDCGAGAGPSKCQCLAPPAPSSAGRSHLPAEIATLVSEAPTTRPWHFALTAAANITFSGQTYLHGWVANRFSRAGGPRLTLTARARQFSSFLVLLGNVTGPNSFEPRHGFIVQNKDEISIPLDMEVIPSAKEFRQAIASISFEQQRFAKAFREMQLESSLFAVCVIQIKPQLEKLLNLPVDTLTKQIRLTQDLLELFIKYNIPSDLLSYHALLNSDQTELAAVTAHVAAMYAMIDSKKSTEIRAAAQEYVLGALTGVPTTTTATTGTLAWDGMVPGRGADTDAYGGIQSSSLPSGSASGFGRVEPGPVATATPSLVIKLHPQPDAIVSSTSAIASTEVADYSKLPAALDARLEQKDPEGRLRPTILSVNETWRKRAQRGLLSAPTESAMTHTAQVLERDKCNDLLDALSRSGLLAFEDAQLHLVLALTHHFDATLMDTLVVQNTNPIDKVERSTLLVAETVFAKPSEQLIANTELATK